MKKIIKRALAESNEIREITYLAVTGLEIPGLVEVGRTAEGIAFKDEEGKAVVIKAIVKALDYNVDFEVTDYVAEQARKAKEAKAKAATKAAKLAKLADEALALVGTADEAESDGDEIATEPDETDGY